MMTVTYHFHTTGIHEVREVQGKETETIILDEYEDILFRIAIMAKGGWNIKFETHTL